MSSAFDCVDHDILLQRLNCSFGVVGVVESWLKSHLYNRTLIVSYNNKVSGIEVIRSGVPQGSVLGPILFLLYISDIFEIVESFRFKGHAFADDIQIVISGPPNDFQATLDKLVNCLLKINSWMTSNRLKLN